jgi:type IV pilus assembly protein PilW
VTNAVRTPALATRRNGFGLTELLVATAISLFLIAAAVTAVAHARRAYRAAEDSARLQETARLALRSIESDLRMAGYWGRHNRAVDVTNAAAPGNLPAGFSPAQAARIDYCGGSGSNWALDLAATVRATNGGYAAACPAYQGAPQPGSDTLTIRRVAEQEPESFQRDRIYLQSDRLHGTLFVPLSGCLSPRNAACLPAGYVPQSSESHQLAVHSYYVAARSTQRPDLPSLRRKVFGNVNAAAVADAVTDEEIAAGIEDLQVQLGLDTDADGRVDRTVDPGPLPAGAAVLAVTLWLRVRTEDPGDGEPSGRTYRYADTSYSAGADDRFRRIVVSRTVHLRNSLR